MPTDLALLTFVKYPEPGKAKTRLAAALGAQLASDWYRYFIDLTLAKTKLVTPSERYVTFSPAERQDDFQALFKDDSHWFPQAASPDLGERIYQAVQTVLERGHRRVLVIGSDSPSLPVEYLSNAAEALVGHDLVLGPAEDGGYYLIGLKSTPAVLFENIAWSTARVLEQTQAAAARAGLSVFRLPEWYDIDDLESLQRFSRAHQFPSQFPLDFLL
ncbi:MAG: TIGR04282 family arsenosugar biosynthesis glycosyltransferase [bacterium]